jgi:hypothetical protein
VWCCGAFGLATLARIRHLRGDSLLVALTSLGGVLLLGMLDRSAFLSRDGNPRGSAAEPAARRASVRRSTDGPDPGSAPCGTAHGSNGASRSDSNLWLATSSGGHGPHLIPVSYWWDGSRLTTATFEGSRTLKNVRLQPKVRAAIGSTGDVLMIDATAVVVAVAEISAEVAERYAQASGNDPQTVPGFVDIQLIPKRIQLWSGAAEFMGRTVMHAGVWLEAPID